MYVWVGAGGEALIASNNYTIICIYNREEDSTLTAVTILYLRLLVTSLREGLIKNCKGESQLSFTTFTCVYRRGLIEQS